MTKDAKSLQNRDGENDCSAIAAECASPLGHPHLAIRPVPSIGEEWVHTLHESFRVAKYPPASDEARSFAQLRRELRVYFGECGELFGVGAATISGLERGSFVCDWAAAERAVRSYVAGRGPRP